VMRRPCALGVSLSSGKREKRRVQYETNKKDVSFMVSMLHTSKCEAFIGLRSLHWRGIQKGGH
jgi:hypothetical protein